MEEGYNCLHQISDHGPDLPEFLRNNMGIGKCSVCVFNEYENPFCKGYSPIKIFVPKENETSENLSLEEISLENSKV